MDWFERLTPFGGVRTGFGIRTWGEDRFLPPSRPAL